MGEEVEELVSKLRWGANAIENQTRLGNLAMMGADNVRVLRNAADTIESLRASLTRVEEERDGRPTIEEWSNEIDRVRDHWKGKLAAQAQDVLNVIKPILQGPAGVELSSAQCEQLVLLEDRLSRAGGTQANDGENNGS